MPDQPTAKSCDFTVDQIWEDIELPREQEDVVAAMERGEAAGRDWADGKQPNQIITFLDDFSRSSDDHQEYTIPLPCRNAIDWSEHWAPQWTTGFCIGVQDVAINRRLT